MKDRYPLDYQIPVLPQRWFFTDPRIDRQLFAIIEQLQAGDGVMFRHDHLPTEERQQLGLIIADVAMRKELILGVKGDPALAQKIGAKIIHQPQGASHLPVSRAVHHEAEAMFARDEETDLVFVAPIFLTNSHPQASPLGVAEAGRLAALAGGKAYALGGMDDDKFAAFSEQIFIGWAGIDAFLPTANSKG